MKFDVVVGNPPYQGDAKQQIYTDFYLLGRQIADVVDMIFPVGWQQPKNANNLNKLNKKAIKEDAQIIQIDNRHNIFDKVAGAEWTNIILWKRGYDNNLNGKQRILTNGTNAQIVRLITDKADAEKPAEILELAMRVQKHVSGFISVQRSTSVRKPYGLSTDVLKDPSKYGLPPIQDSRLQEDDIELWTGGRGGRAKKYVPKTYPFPRVTTALYKYKVFVPYAWGNMSEGAGLGGAYSDIIIASPNMATTETWLESGEFENFMTAQYHAKYLMTQFARALLYVNKHSQHSTTAWDAVPEQDYSEQWWGLSIEEINKCLFAKYDIPESVQEFVRKNIQVKDESNIVNYSG